MRDRAHRGIVVARGPRSRACHRRSAVQLGGLVTSRPVQRSLRGATMKPYLICHMNTSIDGRTWGSRWRPAENRLAGLFERIHEQLGNGSWLIGRVTGSEYAKADAYPDHPGEVFPREPWFVRRDASRTGTRSTCCGSNDGTCRDQTADGCPAEPAASRRARQAGRSGPRLLRSRMGRDSTAWTQR